MPTPTTYYAQAQRYARQFRDPFLTATYASPTTAVAAYAGLQTQFWKHIPNYLSPAFPPHYETEGNPSNLDFFDAYLLCSEHADGLHRAYAGMIAYRIELPAAFVGQTLTSLAVDVACDPYTPDGARVAIATTAAADRLPSSTWLTCREGSAYASGVAPRTSATVGDKLYWYAATDEALVEPAGGLVLGKYLWVYLSLERYDRARNGWLEGCAVIRPTFTLLMADAVGGHAGGSNIGGGYTTPSITLATADVASGPNKLGYTNNGGANKEICAQEIFTAYRKASFTTFSSAAKLDPCVRQLITGAPGNPSPLLAPGTAEAQMRSLFLLNNVTGWNYAQIGLNAKVYAFTVSTVDYVSVTASYYLLPYTPVPGLTPSAMTLTNGSAALDLEGAVVQITPWFVAAPCQLTAAVGNLQWIMQSIARQRNFWTGGATGLTGDTVNNGEVGATDYAINATRIGDPTLVPDTLAAGASFGLWLYNVPDAPGFIVLAAWMPNPSAALLPLNGDAVGLGAVKGHNGELSYTAGTGWLPGIVLT